MALIVVDLPSITIPINTSTGNSVGFLDDALAIGVFAPASLDGTVTLETEASSTGTDFKTQRSGGTAVTFAAGCADTLSPIDFRQMRITSNASESAARVFRITKTIVT